MPAVLDSLIKHQGLTAHKAWRVAYIVPFILIVFIALGMLFTCEDTPTGKWSERMLHVGVSLEGTTTPDTKSIAPESKLKEADYKETNKSSKSSDIETQIVAQPEVEAIKGEVIVAPTRREMMQVVCSLPTVAIAAQYACSFGTELAINSILGSYYAKNFPTLGQTKGGQWAAMFGLLNVVTRPLGGFVSDVLYRNTQSIWAKKLWLVFLGVATGAFLIAIGLSDPKSQATMFGLVAGLAFFLEAANGANFSLVPHVFPAANGKLSLQTLFSRSTLISIQELSRGPLALREISAASSLISSSGIMECIMRDLSG